MKFLYYHLFPEASIREIKPPEGFKLVAIIPSGDAGVNVVFQKS